MITRGISRKAIVISFFIIVLNCVYFDICSETTFALFTLECLNQVHSTSARWQRLCSSKSSQIDYFFTLRVSYHTDIRYRLCAPVLLVQKKRGCAAFFVQPYFCLYGYLLILALASLRPMSAVDFKKYHCRTVTFKKWSIAMPNVCDERFSSHSHCSKESAR